MPPRRKKNGDEATDPQLNIPEPDGLSSPSSDATPKKKRASRSKKSAALPSPAAPPPIERIPAIIPIKTPPPQPAPRISIEPEIHIGEVEDAWVPMPRKGVDLSTPPKPLLQSKKAPDKDLEDFLAADDDEDTDERARFRPPVRTGIYRRIALGFALLALVVGTCVAYAVYARAIVTVHPQQAEIKTERVLSIAAEPKAADEIAGDVAEVTVSGERTGSPQGSTKTDAIATGSVTLINNTNNDQTLVATTRLLAPDDTLFHLKSRVNVPAKGRVAASVYADQPGERGNLAPTSFTIPGLNAALRKDIYAESSAAMTGGVVTAGKITDADIERTEGELREQLVAQARQELDAQFRSPWTGHVYVAETMSRSVNADAGETANGVTVRLVLRVRAVGFDRVKAVDAAAKDLQRGLTSGRELIGVHVDDSSFSIDRADPKTKTASLRISISGQSRVSLDSPLFDAGKLRGLGLEDVRKYFTSIEGVERVDVAFRPFWLKRMPLLLDRIEFQIEK